MAISLSRMSHFSDKLHSAPFIRLLVPFVAGIVLGDPFPPDLKWVFLGASFFFSALLIFFITISFKKQYLFGIFLFPALLFLGIFTTTDLKYRPQPLSKGEYFAVIHEFPLEKEKSFRAVIRLTEPKISVLAYFEKSGFPGNAEPGTIVWFRGRPELLQKTGNPYDFDYQAYAIRNGIGHRIYLKASNYHLLKAEKNMDLTEWSLIIRDRLLRILENCGLKDEIFHLVSSISLGAREELEPETTQSFAKTGVIHVLAVSGMNVAIIFVVLDLMLRFLKRKKGGIILYTLIILTAVWGYALITGMSASVLRAAAMFSFIVIGKNMSRHPDIYNTLAASAFVLICFNPSLVYDVGFQLSYAAVFSIVCFHPSISGLLYFKYWVPNQIWGLLTVSVAAQIGTIPFLLHYFHQFPTWFLLANLMVIPLVSVILYLACIVFVVAPIAPFLGILITKILDVAGQAMLFSVHFVEKLPYSVLDGLYPSDFTLLLVVLFAILISVFILYKSRIALTGALISIIILLISNNISSYQQLTRREVVVFNLSGKTLIAFTTGRETIWLTTDKGCDVEKLKYYTKPYEGYRGIKKSSMVCLSDPANINTGRFSRKANFIDFEGLTLSVLNDRKPRVPDWEHFPQTEIIVLAEKSSYGPARVQKYLPEAVIIESRPSAGESGASRDLLKTSAPPKVLNTTLGGAVLIKFQPANEREKNMLSCRYFE
jgi:competence protein ComEC